MMQIGKSPVEYQERHELGSIVGTTESAAGIIEDVKAAKRKTSPTLLGKLHSKPMLNFEA